MCLKVIAQILTKKEMDWTTRHHISSHPIICAPVLEWK